MSNTRPSPSNRSERPRRSAVGGAGANNVLTTIGQKDPNYFYYFAMESQVEEFKGYGYEVVQDGDLRVDSRNPISSGSARSVVVNRSNGQKGVLMRQPMEFHKEDQKLRAEAIAKSEESMYRLTKTEEGRYGSVETSNSLAREIED